MSTGVWSVILLGVLWSFVGMTVALARKRHCPIWSFYCCGAGLATLLCAAFGCLALNGLRAIDFGMWGLLAVGAGFNALGQALTMYNLRGGARALLFALPQTNFVYSYLFAVCFLHERASITAVCGILLLFAAILGAGMLKGDRGRDPALPDSRQLLLGITAAAVIGIGQIALLLAGIRQNAELNPGTRAALVLVFSTLAYGIGAAWEWKAAVAQYRSVLKYGVSWALFAALSYAVLFRSLGLMNRAGKSGVVFAVGCSVCILMFWLFSLVKMKDRTSLKQIVFMTAIIAGLFLLVSAP